MGIESIVVSGRRLIATALLDRARIEVRALVPDGRGGHREQFTERKGDVKCWFARIADTDPILALDSVFGRPEMLMICERGTVATEGDRVRNLYDDRTWQIVKDVTAPSELQIAVRFGIKGI
jgi:hypothetical protein